MAKPKIVVMVGSELGAYHFLHHGAAAFEDFKARHPNHEVLIVNASDPKYANFQQALEAVKQFAGTGNTHLFLMTHYRGERGHLPTVADSLKTDPNSLYWNAKVPMKSLLEGLPANVTDIALAGCEAQDVETIASSIKPGVAVYPMSHGEAPMSDRMYEWSSKFTADPLGKEGATPLEQMQMLLASESLEYLHKIATNFPQYGYTTDPDQAFPNKIFIGGNPPRAISLEEHLMSNFLVSAEARDALIQRMEALHRAAHERGEFPEYKAGEFANHMREVWDKLHATDKPEFDPADRGIAYAFILEQLARDGDISHEQHDARLEAAKKQFEEGRGEPGEGSVVPDARGAQRFGAAR